MSPELAALLDSRQNPNADFNFNFGLDFSAFGAAGAHDRSIYSETRTTQISAGLRGDFASIDGTWDVIVSEGTAKLDVRLEGYASLERTRTLFTRSPNWGYGFFAQGNSSPPGGGFSGGVARCTTGMPVFRNHAEVSEDCLKAIFSTLNHQSEMKQKFVEANIQGHLVDMPAGEARFSAGVHSRESSYYYIFDPLQTQESFNDNPMGFPANNTIGETAVDEIYGELLLPLLSGKPGAEHLNLELGYRYSDYDLQGGVDTFKALIDWGITETVRFRGGRQLATRAPNIAEMFQADTQSWTFASPGDPCGRNSIAAYGANSARNPNFQRAIDICSARMGIAGAATFYTGTQPNGNSWTPFSNATGNPRVNPEEATTWTAGIVWSPNTGHERLDGLNLTVDYYSIEIEDMISVEPALAVYEQCLSVSSNPTSDPLHPACLRINRNPVSGFAAPTTVSYINAAFAKVSGVDVTADWRTDLAGGSFGVNFMISKLLEEKTQATAASPVYDWKGSLGPDPGTSLNNGAFDYRTFTTVSYGRSDWNLALAWRHLPTAIDGNEVVAGAAATLRGAEESYDVFDLSGSWSLSERTQIRFGVDNVFDTPPVWTGRRTAQDLSPSTGSGTTEAGFYDILGRSYYVGVKASF